MNIIYREGNLMVADFGHLSIQSLLIPKSLSNNNISDCDGNSTACYSSKLQNLEVLFNDIQILFMDSGEEWRLSRMIADTEFHLLSKIYMQVLCSSVGKADEKHSRNKFNIALPSFKINLSDRRLKQLLKFVRKKIPLPSINYSNDPNGIKKGGPDRFWEPSISCLNSIGTQLAVKNFQLNNKIMEMNNMADDEKLVEVLNNRERIVKKTKSEDYSDGKEQWARTVDLPGFEDNVSPTNFITSAICLIIGEVVLQIARSSDFTDKPYLMFRLEKLAIDVAMMTFGPALQLSIGGFQVVDKLHVGLNGEYLELLNSEVASPETVVTILYRKVSSDCPDFKSYFYSVEQSLVVTINKVITTFHQGAIVTVEKYFEYIADGLNLRDTKKHHLVDGSLKPDLMSSFSSCMNSLLLTSLRDPPVPTGATKYSVSFRFDRLSVRFCDSEVQLAELELAGLEMDYLQKANEKKVFHAYLQYIAVTDLSDIPFYSKIITPEDDKVFELKYIQNCDLPCRHVLSEETLQKKCDMHLKFQMKKLKICLLSKFINDMAIFMELFLQYQMAKIQSNIKAIKENLISLIKCGSVVNLSIEIQAPVLVMPSKQDLSNAILFHLGDIELENYVKVVNCHDGHHFADNILIRWKNLQMNRVIIMYDGTFEDAEVILEQAKVRLDIIREIVPSLRDHLISICGVMDTIKINIGHRDLALILAIYKETISIHGFSDVASVEQVVSPPSNAASNDLIGKKLQAFFNTSVDIIKEASFHFSLEGAEIVFGNERKIIKPQNDNYKLLNITALQLEEASIDIDIFNNGYLEMKCSVQSICLEDIRHDTSFASTRILHYYEENVTSGKTTMVKSPIIFVSYKQEPNGNVKVDITVEKTRVNLSIPYIFTLTEFVYQAWLHSQNSAGKAINCIKGKTLIKAGVTMANRIVKYPKQHLFKSSTNSVEETSNFTISAFFKAPEIVFHVDHTDSNSQLIVFKMNVTINSSFVPELKLFSLSITDFKIATFSSSKRLQSSMIVHPCDFEFCKTCILPDLITNINIAVSPIDLRISPTIIHIANSIMNELSNITKIHPTNHANKLQRHLEAIDHKDLWEIRKIISDSCTKTDNTNEDVKTYYRRQEENLNFSIASIQVIFELDQPEERVPVLVYEIMLKTEAHNWSRQLYLKTEIQMEVSYFNNELLKWEALLEPVTLQEGKYRPCLITFKVFRQTACPVICNDVDYILSSGSCLTLRSQAVSETSSSDDTNSEDVMTIIRKPCGNKYKLCQKQKEYVRSTLDSGSDNEAEAMDKLTIAFGHMFSSESSDDQFSECEGYFEKNINCLSDNGNEKDESSDGECSVMSSSTLAENKSYISRQRSEDSVDSGVEDMSLSLATYVLIDIKDKLNFTVTPSIFRVINDIIETFKNKPTIFAASSFSGCSVQLCNKIGLASSITVFQNNGKIGNVLAVATDKDSDFHLSPASTAPEVELSPSDSNIVDERNEDFIFPPKLSTEKVDAFNYGEESVTSVYHRMTKEKLQINVEGFDIFECYLSGKSSTKIFALHPQKNETTYHLTVNVEVHRNYTTIHVSSPLQIKNCLEQAVHLYYIKDILENLELSSISHLKNPFGEYIWLATIQPDDTYYVPLYAAYHCPIFFQPAYLGYQVSENSVWWQDVSSSPTSSRFIACPSKVSGKIGYSFKAWCKELNPSKPSIGLGTLVPNYIISLHPSITVHNYLPFQVALTSPLFEKEIKLEPGALMPIVLIDLIRGQRIGIEVANYNGFSWKGGVDISECMEHNKTLCLLGDFITGLKQHRQLHIDIKVVNVESMHIYLYAPYWIINKTNLPLQFRGSGSSVIYESHVNEDPVLFRFKHHRRRRCKTRVYNSKWSVSYSIDNVGNSGLVMCKDTERNKKYKFFLNIHLSKTQLTKIITLRPYYVIVNCTKHHLRFLEKNDKTDFWMDISPHDSMSFWPDTNNMQMLVKIRDSKILSQSFFFNRTDLTVLRMDHGTALCVDVCGGQHSPWTVVFKTYIAGSAPVRVDNRCDDIFLKFHQKSMCQVTLLSPFESVLYTWDDPTKERTILWNICNRKKTGFPACINKDGCGQETVSFHTLRPNLSSRQMSISNRRKSYAQRLHPSSSDDDSDVADKGCQQTLNKKIRSDKVVVYWVSYLEKNQRVLMFTQDDNIARQAKKKISGSHACLEWCLSIRDIGLSVVSHNYKEVAYLSLVSAPSVWDVEINHKWKILPLELSAWLETEWKKEQTRAEMTGYVQVDFNKMLMTKPFFGRLRRRYFPALWCQFRCSEYLSFLHLKIHRLQIDNQLQNALNTTVLHPTPIASQIVNKFGYHPFLELSLVQRHDPKQSIKVIKYFKVLIQEFQVNLDTEFLESISSIIRDIKSTRKEIYDSRKHLHNDLTIVQAPIVSSSSFMQNEDSKNYMYEYLHISPIKINFNFTPLKPSFSSRTIIKKPNSNLLDFILSAVCVSLNEVKDVELRLVYFERRGIKCPPTEILNDIKNHYARQALQQSYVYIVGVDVLGNPYSDPKDFTQDLGDQYYEPSLGIVRLAEEYAESTAVELERLLGYYVSRNRKSSFLLSGHLANAEKFLMFEEDCEMKRQTIDKTLEFPDSLAAASKTLAVGVIMGVSGVHVKSLQGIHQLGVEGYLKGIGKGLLSVINKSVDTDNDMVAITYDGIRRAEEIGDDIICRIRLPRYIDTGEGVKPYSCYKAAGQRLVWKLARGHYSESDTYCAHAAMTHNDHSRAILLTDRHIFELFRNAIWVDWNIAWKVNADDILGNPIIAGNRMVFKVREDKNQDLFPGDERYIVCDDIKVLYWLKEKVEKILIARMEDRVCPIEV